MPDPLLMNLQLDADFEQMVADLSRFDAALSRDEQFVFLECHDPSGHQILARIDCRGYSLQPPDVQFLDPAEGMRIDARPSLNVNHWPRNPPPLNRNGALHLCLAGTRSYLLFHGDPGYALSLNRLVPILVLWCQGQGALLQQRPGR